MCVVVSPAQKLVLAAKRARTYIKCLVVRCCVENLFLLKEGSLSNVIIKFCPLDDTVSLFHVLLNQRWLLWLGSTDLALPFQLCYIQLISYLLEHCLLLSHIFLVAVFVNELLLVFFYSFNVQFDFERLLGFFVLRSSSMFFELLFCHEPTSTWFALELTCNGLDRFASLRLKSLFDVLVSCLFVLIFLICIKYFLAYLL